VLNHLLSFEIKHGIASGLIFLQQGAQGTALAKQRYLI
jgi:hypothetical protein